MLLADFIQLCTGCFCRFIAFVFHFPPKILAQFKIKWYICGRNAMLRDNIKNRKQWVK